MIIRRARIALIAALAAISVALTLAPGADAGLVASAKKCPGSDSLSASVASQKKAMLCLINHARSSKGMNKLRLSNNLSQAADAKTRDDIKCGDFSHTPCGKDFTQYFYRSGYLPSNGAWGVGENIAWASPSRSVGTAQKIFKAWLDSPEHRENLFNPKWRHTGLSLRISKFQGVKNARLWSNTFGYGGKR